MAAGVACNVRGSSARRSGVHPPASYGGGRCSGHRRVLRRPNSDALSNTSARTLRTRRVAMPIGKVRPGHREATRGGCNRALERTVLLKGGLQPPRPTRPRGSTTAGRDRIDALGRRLRQAGDVGWIANEADPGGGGRARARPAWRLATIHATKGAPGDRPGGGLQTSLGKNVLFKGGLQPPGRSRAQGRSRTALLPDPLRRGRGSPQRRPILWNLRGKRRIGAASTRLFR